MSAEPGAAWFALQWPSSSGEHFHRHGWATLSLWGWEDESAAAGEINRNWMRSGPAYGDVEAVE